ncbi:ABC transporter I family member 10, chloroplastic [Porphyridium purpureum]|uniref:Probable ATP-dependent transporter ycf16 n=1 Tax=Porphyridium purpureum TaxID=35688 RepID=A0A5J4Z338_PORPP|nr:ABC transporter I family member 10, chloroplastic [Porphyridium purpureum]|eukprot:POR0753..scf295_1
MAMWDGAAWIGLPPGVGCVRAFAHRDGRERICVRRTPQGLARNAENAPRTAMLPVDDGTGRIAVQNLSFAWRDDLRPWKAPRPVLKQLTFEVLPGEVVMLLGANGCGKSTLLQILGGVLFADSGTVVAPERTYLFLQNMGETIMMHTVRRDLEFCASSEVTDPAEIDARIKASLATVKLEAFEGREVEKLSGGERQRVALAGALVFKPDAFLMDEPTAAMDRRNRVNVVTAICNWARESRVPVLWVTHLKSELSYADRIIIMHEGQITRQGSPREMAPFVDAIGSRQTN